MAAKGIPRCSTCSEELSSKERIGCKMCGKQFHLACTGLPRKILNILDLSEEISKAVQDSFYWFCRGCQDCLDLLLSKVNSENSGMAIASTNTSLSESQSLAVSSSNPLSSFTSSRDGLVEEENKETILKSFKENLKRRYRTIEPLCDLTKHLCERDDDDPLQSYFVEPELQEYSLEGNISEPVGLSEIFRRTADEGTEEITRIFITGKSGFGKTTIAKRICYDWASAEASNYLSDFDIAVYTSPNKVGDRPLERALLEEMCCSEKNRLRNVDKLSQIRLLVVLDGLDFDAAKLQTFLASPFQECRKIFARLTFILASGNPLHCISYSSRCFRILGLGKETQSNYIRKVLGDSRSGDLIEKIEKHRSLKKPSKCPMFLHLMCCLYRKLGKPMVTSRTDLYLETVKLLLRNYEKKMGINEVCERILYSDQPFPSKIMEDDLFLRLGKMAFGILSLEKIPETISWEGEMKEKDDIKFLVDLGILIEIPDFYENGEKRAYDFIHCSFKEFLCSVYVVNEIKVNLSKGVESKTNKYHYLESRSKNISYFLYGLLAKDVPILREYNYSVGIAPFSVTPSKLLEFKNEARLNKEDFKELLRVSGPICLRHSHPFDDYSSFATEFSFSELSLEVSTSGGGSNKDIGRCVTSILTSADSCPSLEIRLSTDFSYYPCGDANYALIFINMKHIMRDVVSTFNVIRPKFPEERFFPFSIDLHCKEYLRDDGENSAARSAPENSANLIKNQCIALLPQQIRVTERSPCEPMTFFKWIIHKNYISIYVMKMAGIEKRKEIPLPLIVITSEEYRELQQPPFLYQDNLKADGFDTVPSTNSFGNFKIPSSFGCATSGMFFERLDKFGDEIIERSSDKDWDGMVDTILFTNAVDP